MKKISIYFIAFTALLFTSCSADSDGGFASGADNGGVTTGQGGSLARFTIANNHLFAVNGTKLKAFDISDRQNPVFKNETNLNVDVETIFARDASTIFIGTRQGMFIYDVSNAPTLNHLSDYEHVVSCDPVVANNEYAYVTLHTSIGSGFCQRGVNQLDVIDVRNLQSISQVNSLNMEEPKGLGLYGDTLIVCDNGLKVFDITQGNQPTLINTVRGIEAVDLIPLGDLMIIRTETGIEQYRYRNANFTFLSRI